MRLWLTLFLLLTAAPALTAEVIVSVRPERSFGYFVGDLIQAEVEVLAADDKELSRASLPHPGPLGVSLVLREVVVRESRKNDRRTFLIDLVYQNFYVALDVHSIQIPGFELRVGGESIAVPAWSVSVSPLREVVPAPVEDIGLYLRPDNAADFADEATPRVLALSAALCAAASLVLVARDRGWPPFHRRRTRVFNILARSLAKRSGADVDAAWLREAIKSLHRAIDATNGATVLAQDLPAFLARHPRFAAQRSGFEHFFELSRETFFGDAAEAPRPEIVRQLLQFSTSLARLERAA